jgi:IS30 family transposase
MRHRSHLALSATEREEISRAIASGWSFRAIGRQLRRPPSTISREVHRHGGRLRYRAALADAQAWRAARRPKACRLARHAPLRRIVAEKLAADWSPQQIAGWRKLTYPDHAAMQVSHETIYLSLLCRAEAC